VKNIIAQSNFLILVEEYQALGTLDKLSNLEADRVIEILELAQSDPLLNYLIQEVDIYLANQLKFLDFDCLHYYENQRAKLREYLETKLEEKLINQTQPFN
jgi:hypothetical protein